MNNTLMTINEEETFISYISRFPLLLQENISQITATI